MKQLKLFVFPLVIAILLSSVITTPTYALADNNKALSTETVVTNKSFETTFTSLNRNNAELTGTFCFWCWSTAIKMAAKGFVNSTIKSFLQKSGLSCPKIGPWWLCAKPVY